MGLGFADLLQALPAIFNSFKGVNTQPQQNIASQQGNIASAMYDPNNPLFKKLFGEQKQNIQANTASTIAQAANQNRLQSAMGRTPLFSPERNGEQAFRQSVIGQQGADLEAQNQARGILSGGMTGLNSAMTGANNVTQLQYGTQKTNAGANNQNQVGFNSIAQLLRGGGMTGGSPFSANADPSLPWSANYRGY